MSGVEVSRTSVVVGRLGKAHGLAGELTVEVRTDEPETRFAPGAVLLTDPVQRGPLVVESSRWAGTRLVVRIRGVADRTAADALRNTMLLAEVDPSERPSDPEEYYDHQLLGCSVHTAGGEPVGLVAEVLHLPSQDLLVVRTEDAREVLVPFVEAIVTAVDLSSRRLEVTPPPGLLDAAGSE